MPAAVPDDLEAKVDRLLSYEQIRQLVYRYAVAVDARDVDTIESLFVDDVRVAPGATGRDALGASYEEMLAVNEYSILNVGNVLIDFDDADHARGVVYCRGEMPTPDGEWLVQAIVYHDRYDRRDGEWLFRGRRHLLFYGADVLQRPIGLPPAGQPEITTGKGSMPEFWDTFRAFRARHGDGADRG